MGVTETIGPFTNLIEFDPRSINSESRSVAKQKEFALFFDRAAVTHDSSGLEPRLSHRSRGRIHGRLDLGNRREAADRVRACSVLLYGRGGRERDRKQE